MNCLRGGCKFNPKCRNGYDKFVSEEDDCNSGGLPEVIRLKKPRGEQEKEKRKRCPSVQLDCVVKKFKGAYRKVVQIAKRSGSSYFMDLLTNNQLLVHLSASPHTPRKRKLYPTVGFTNINITTNNNDSTTDSNHLQPSQSHLKMSTSS